MRLIGFIIGFIAGWVFISPHICGVLKFGGICLVKAPVFGFCAFGINLCAPIIGLIAGIILSKIIPL